MNSIILTANRASLGDSASLKCESNNPIRAWYKSIDGFSLNSALVYNGTENRIFIIDTALSASLFRSTLNIDFVVETDFGVYQCIDSLTQSTTGSFTKQSKISYMRIYIFILAILRRHKVFYLFSIFDFYFGIILVVIKVEEK